MPNDPFCHAHSTSCKYPRHSFSTCVTDTATSRAHSTPQKISSLSCTHRALPKNSACHAQSISSNCFPGHAPSTCVPNICHQWRTQHSSINVFACHAYIRYTNEPFCHAHSISCKYPRHSLSTCVTDTAISRAHSILLKCQACLHTLSPAQGPCLSCTEHFQKLFFLAMLSAPVCLTPATSGAHSIL